VTVARIAKSVRVTGLVQGVFFRAWTREHADALGVTGWVRNCSDGSVEAHVEGVDAAVKQLVALLRRGPPSAQVEDVNLADATLSNFSRFEVRH
jgi:acylphosphatase